MLFLSKLFSLLLLLPLLINALPLRESSTDSLEARNTGDVKFYLYTRDNADTPQQLYLNNDKSVLGSNFSKTRHTKILIHGWGGSYTTTPNVSVRRAYLKHDNYNIISVDWNAYSKLNYLSARAKVPIVGEDVAELVDYLHSSFGLDFKTLVVIGHSLGAHVAGFTGKSVKLGKVEAIVGLDPAYPLYSFENPATRLADTDANYVQTIQTNGNVKGFLKPIGSASFYPNWGRLQPGCGMDLDGSCSHGRSVTYYAEAVSGYSFSPFYKCDDYEYVSAKRDCENLQYEVQIGDPLQIIRSNGIFYFVTTDKTPFGHLTAREAITV